MTEQIKNIKNKINQLRNLDTNLTVFASDSHKYLFNSVLTIEQIQQFQEDNNVELPEDFVEFLIGIGNGGAGPFYGIHSLEESRINYFDNTGKGNHTYFNLSKSFPHTESWNAGAQLEELYEKIEMANEAGNVELEEQLYEQKWDIIGDEKHDFGRLNICDYGCGLQISLIVKGQEKGNIWCDDRTNDAGLYPTIELGNTGRITFLNWYELWLDNSINEILTKPKS